MFCQQRGVTSLSAALLSENGRNINVLIVSERGESSHLNYVYARLQQTVQKKNFLVVMPRAELLRHTVVVLSVILSVRYAYLVTR